MAEEISNKQNPDPVLVAAKMHNEIAETAVGEAVGTRVDRRELNDQESGKTPPEHLRLLKRFTNSVPGSVVDDDHSLPRATPSGFADGDHVCVAALVQLQNRQQPAMQSANVNNQAEIKQAEAQLNCRHCNREAGSDAVKCSNPDCGHPAYHLECLNDTERELHRSYQDYLCQACLKELAIEYFSARTPVWRYRLVRGRDAFPELFGEIENCVASAEEREVQQVQDEDEEFRGTDFSLRERNGKRSRPVSRGQGRATSKKATKRIEHKDLSTPPETTPPQLEPTVHSLPAESPLSDPVFHQVDNLNDLDRVALRWAVPWTRMTPKAGGDQDTTTHPKGKQFVKFECKAEGERPLPVPVDLNTLSTMSRIIHTLRERADEPLDGASVALPTISKAVVVNCVQYMRKEHCVKLPTANVTESSQLLLLQYCHFAHIFCIKQLARACMLALCISIFTHPGLWSDHKKNARMIEEIGISPNNPASRMLLQTYKSVIPQLEELNWRSGVPCNRDVVEEICEMDETKCDMLWWGADRKYRIIYDEAPESQSSSRRNRNKRKKGPLNPEDYRDDERQPQKLKRLRNGGHGGSGIIDPGI
ncbi:hypothetical protein H2200_001445 [Cladophialophora chaetospira]|uniref:PHD-type domain-containing protein n=1 Tax=Cladophialophora chaetospira TaxID=386627 RepID=A0AA39CPM0_9EURO|nr:hypothetical protein H2200_001445 [Cladophialophora chaetospira]